MNKAHVYRAIFAQNNKVYMVKRLLTLDDVQPLQSDSRLDSVKERRKRNMQDEAYDLDLLTECNRSWMNKDSWRQEMSVLYRYVFGNQWGDYVHVHGLGDITEEQLIKMQGNMPLKNNVMVSIWMSIFGVHAKQETELIL